MQSVAAALLIVSGQVAAMPSDAPPLACRTKIERMISDSEFRHRAVSVPSYRPKRPDTRTGRARLYRTTISADASHGANFAGHYTISMAGCGTRTSCVAIIDQRTGAVHFPSQLRTASRPWLDLGDYDPEALNFRIWSDMLVLVGSPNERNAFEGVSTYQWSGNRLRRTGYIPMAKLCPRTGRMQF